jgi:PH (Pleckstrin Homology) domain-containing protein
VKQFITREHEIEPVSGLPENLPRGETVLWQGRPSARLFSRYYLKKHWIAGYFLLLTIWSVAGGLYDGRPVQGIAFSVAVLFALAAIVISMLEFYAWAVEKTTVYTITNHRIVIRFGVAFSMTLNLPFRQVSTVSKAELRGKAGHLAIKLLRGHRMSWLVQWPHVRAWRFSDPEPSLVCLADAQKVAEILALAVTQDASMRLAAQRQWPVEETIDDSSLHVVAAE